MEMQQVRYFVALAQARNFTRAAEACNVTQPALTDPDVVVRPLVEPEFTRTVYLTTMRGRPHSPAVGAFAREARVYRAPTATGQAP